MTKNRLTLNYSKSNYMILSKNVSKTAHFKPQIKQNIIPQTNSVKYLGVILDNTFLWQTHIDKISNKLSRVCEMVFKLRHYVPLFTLKLIYYSMFNSILQYSLMNWGRTSKCHLYRIKVLQNRFLRASLFRKRDCPINVLHSTFGALKLDDMIEMKHAKFYIDSIKICYLIILKITLLI